MNKSFLNVNEYINKLYMDIDGLKDFITEVSSKGELYILGGALRDIYFSSDIRDYSVRDLDLIYDFSKIEFLDIIRKYDYKKNRFGGYKININEGFEVDIWSYKDNWANKNFLIDEGSNKLKNISDGTYYNIDSLVYSYNKKEVYDEKFKKGINKSEVDFSFNSLKYIYSNPSKEVNILRALNFNYKYNLKLSRKIKEYIREYYSKNQSKVVKEIYLSQTKHYNEEVLTREEIYRLIKKNI